MVIHRLLDRPDGKLQGAISYLTGFRTHLGWFHVDKLLLFQLANVLGYGVSTHPGVLTNASDAGPALMCLPVLTVNQVGVDGQLTGGKSQSENLIGQKKIMAQWAALSVSVLEFRGVTSLMIFQDSTPMSLPMSIEKTKFTLRSQVYSCMPFSKPLLRSPFFVYSTTNSEAAPPLF